MFYKLHGAHRLINPITIIQPLKVQCMDFNYCPFGFTYKYKLTIYTTELTPKFFNFENIGSVELFYKTELDCMLEMNNIKQIQNKYFRYKKLKIKK